MRGPLERGRVVAVPAADPGLGCCGGRPSLLMVSIRMPAAGDPPVPGFPRPSSLGDMGSTAATNDANRRISVFRSRDGYDAVSEETPGGVCTIDEGARMRKKGQGGVCMNRRVM